VDIGFKGLILTVLTRCLKLGILFMKMNVFGQFHPVIFNMKKKSDTPRTDRAESRSLLNTGPAVPAKFARQLERELVETKLKFTRRWLELSPDRKWLKACKATISAS
jgi:hypothetical protein